MLSNLPPGVTDAMIEEQFGEDPCAWYDDGHCERDGETCFYLGDEYLCNADKEADEKEDSQ